MIDPTQLPILLKAVDFIFDEGRKILQERRERRKISDTPAEIEAPKSAAEIVEDPPQAIIASKQDLLTSKVDEILWKSHEEEISHLVRLLDTYSKNYRLTKEKYAKWGSTLVPSVVVHEMDEAENAMIETTGKLEVLLAKVYQRENPPSK